MNETLLTRFAQGLLSIFGLDVVTFVPALLLIIVLIIQIRIRRFDISIIFLLLAIFPAISPFISKLLGYEYYTYMNLDLQGDMVLVTAAIVLICLFSGAFLWGGLVWAPRSKKRTFLPAAGQSTKVIVPTFAIPFIFALNFALLFFFLEDGNVLTQAYGDFKKLGASPYSSLVNQIFNLSVAICLSFIGRRDRKRLILLIYFIFIVLAILVSRRTLALGLIILACFTLRDYKISLRQIFLFSAVFLALIFIGEARKVGIINYLGGTRAGSLDASIFALPGGASNIFVSVLGVVDLLNQNIVNGWNKLPFVFWLFGDLEPLIYGGFRYDYNGGMHIASIVYWNFGLVGVLLVGAILGKTSARVQAIMSDKDGVTEGSLRRMLSYGFVISMPNLIWYHPVGLIKLLTVIMVIYFSLRMLRHPHAHSIV